MGGYFMSLRRRARRLYSFPSSAGRSLRSLGSAPCGAPARSRRPGRCTARSLSALMPGWPPGVLFHFPRAPGARSARLATRLAARRRGRAGRAAALPGPSRLSCPVGRRAHFIHFPRAPGARTLFISLRRRALAPLDRAPPRAWTRDAYAPGGAPARSRRPGRRAARSRSHPHLVGRRGLAVGALPCRGLTGAPTPPHDPAASRPARHAPAAASGP